MARGCSASAWVYSHRGLFARDWHRGQYGEVVLGVKGHQNWGPKAPMTDNASRVCGGRCGWRVSACDLKFLIDTGLSPSPAAS